MAHIVKLKMANLGKLTQLTTFQVNSYDFILTNSCKYDITWSSFADGPILLIIILLFINIHIDIFIV